MMAMSGWSGDKADGALCNKKYSAAVRQLCNEYKLKLPNSFYDNVRLLILLPTLIWAM